MNRDPLLVVERGKESERQKQNTIRARPELNRKAVLVMSLWYPEIEDRG